jgi:hypothetical protein
MTTTTTKEFIDFLSAVVHATPVDKRDSVLDKLSTLPPETIQLLMARTVTASEPLALRAFVIAKASNLRGIVKAATAMFNEDVAWQLVDDINIAKTVASIADDDAFTFEESSF